jgi:hypothetical protein
VVKEIERRVADVQRRVGTGSVVRVNGKPNPSRRLRTVTPIRRPAANVEVIDIDVSDDEGMDKWMERDYDLRRKCAIRVTTDVEKARAERVLQALKDAVVKYYFDKIPVNTRNELMHKVITG